MIAATNKNLQQQVENGAFREDLYFRLNVVPITAPPLRHRKEDIPLLSEHFLKGYADENDFRPKEITPDAMEALKNYSWPGNIRELKNLIERLSIMVAGRYGPRPSSDRSGRTRTPTAAPTPPATLPYCPASSPERACRKSGRLWRRLTFQVH